jgi:hypothetical protein
MELIGRLATLRDQCESGKKAAATVLPQLSALQDGIRSHLEQLGQLERDIAKARDLIGQCRDCPNRPNRRDCPHCPVDKHVELSEVARLIWDPDCP